MWLDEVTLNDPAKELALHGHLRSSVFIPYYGFDRAYFWQPPGATLVTALSYKLFGFGIWQTRVPGVVFGAGTIFLLYLFAFRLLNDRRAALVAALLFSLDPQLIQTARAGRMDTQCLFLALLGLLLYLRAEASLPKRSVWLAASGLAVGLAGVTHPLAVVWAIALLLLILLLGAEPRWKSAAVFALGAGLPPGIWVANALRTPQLFVSQFLIHGQEHLISGGPFTRLYEEAGRYLRLNAYLLVPFLLVTYAAAWLWLVFNPKYARPLRLRVLILFLVPFLFNAFFLIKYNYYFLHPGLILAVSAGALIAGLLPPGWTRPRTAREFAILIFLLLLAGNLLARGILGRYVTLAYQWQARDYHRQVEVPLRQHIPAGSLIWGPPEAWYAVEKAGASLRLEGRPDPQVHDYAIIKTKQVLKLGSGFHKIGELGQPLPPLFGRVNVWSADYQMQIWKSDLRPQPKLSN